MWTAIPSLGQCVTRSPTLDEVYQVMAKASVGEPARVELPNEPDPSDAATKLAIALNLLLDDLEYRARMQRELEEQLRQTHKLEAIGRLAGGIAHDFNNLLSVIIGNAELARQDLVPDGPGYEEVEQIEFAAARAAELTRQLLAFGRKQLFHFTAVDLSEIVRGMSAMLKRLLGEQIELATFSTTPLGNVLVRANASNRHRTRAL
ncbi:MAG: hypothetical protein JKY37_09090 [Nannocystaceae bacterium]|nr:hypothetical protein [Nannocystaceae bacterium]